MTLDLKRSRNGGNFRQSVIVHSKGLINNPGENNCFMNSAVQVLWHLDVFRRSFRLLDGHACLEECCIFCALKEIFGKFQESDEAVLPSCVLRIAMAKAFQDQRKFQIGRMGDAAECFENILRRLHYHITFGVQEDTCNTKHCIPHQKFSMQILEQVSCKCGATSEPFSFFQIVNYVAASAMVEEARRPQINGLRPYKSFGELLNVTLSHDENRQCPDEKKCTYKDKDGKGRVLTKMHRTLLNCPDIVCIGINWDTDRPSAEYVEDVLDCLGKRLEVKDLFDKLSDERAKKMKLRLFGIMTYYGKHYTTFFYNTRQETWYYLDDARVKEVGKEWASVKDRCKLGRFQPLLVFYVNQDGEPIKVNKAPKQTEITNKEELLMARNNNGLSGQFEGESPEKDSPRRKSAKKDKTGDSKHAPAKRKSLKKIMTSAFKKDKTKDRSSPTKVQPRYSGDLVLSVNGQDSSMGIIGPYSEINGYIEENAHAVNGEKERESPVKNSQSSMGERTSPSSPKERSLSEQNSAMNVYERSPQTHRRLKKHQEQLKSLEANKNSQDDASDYDNLSTPKMLQREQPSSNRKISSDEQTRTRSRNQNVEDGIVVGSESKRYSLGKMPDSEFIKQIQPQRRFIDEGDAYADAIDEAESLVISSIAAEQEGNLLESYHLCGQAKIRYKSAMELQGITEKMRAHADMKRWETSNRSRLLSTKISESRERASKSADYARQISKTSDYGSLSDTSGSPLAQNGYPSSSSQKFILETRRKSQDYPMLEKGGIQAKLNKERIRVDSSKKQNDPTKSIFFTLPRQKKSNKQHKLSAKESPTQSEMEDLSNLLKNLDNDEHSKRRNENGDSNKEMMQHKSEPHLALGYTYSSRMNNGQPSIDVEHKENNPKVFSLKAQQNSFEHENAKSYPSSVQSNESNITDRYQQVALDRPEGSPRHVSKSVGLSSSSSQPSSKTIMCRSEPDVAALQTKVTRPENQQNGKIPTGHFDAKCSSIKRSEEERVIPKPRAGSELSSRSARSENNLSDSGRFSVEDEDHENTETIASKEKEKESKPVERKRSIFRVIVPKFMNTEKVQSVKKQQKEIKSREEQYKAMMNAHSQMTSSRRDDTMGKQVGSLNVRAASEHNSPSKQDDERGNKRLQSGSNREAYDRSVDSLEISDSAVDEVIAVTKIVTTRRLFDGNSLLEGSPSVSNSASPMDRKKTPSPLKNYQSQNKHQVLRIDSDDDSQDSAMVPCKRSAPSAGQPASIAERFAIDKKNSKPIAKRPNEFIRNAVSQNSLVQQNIKKLEHNSQDVNEGPASEGSSTKVGKNIQDSIAFFSKSQPNIFDSQEKQPRNDQIEPPPRKNPYVYRSSELYKPKSETKNLQAAPQSNQESEKDMGDNSQRSGYSQVDFSKSPRQMCQQCGTVTVEKPRKFCRKCQSDYL